MASSLPIPVPEGFDALSLPEKRAYVLALRRRLEADEAWRDSAQDELKTVLDQRCSELDRDPARRISGAQLMERVRQKAAAQ